MIGAGRKLKQFTIEERLKHLKDAAKMPGSDAAYCKIHNIPKSTFGSWKSDYKENKLISIPGDNHRFRNKSSEFRPVEDELVKYINRRNELYKRDKCGLSWLVLKTKAREIADRIIPLVQFSVSDGWISSVLKRNDLIRHSLHGEAAEVDEAVAGPAMAKFRNDLADLCNRYCVMMEEIYNADQTGLYYQKLPNQSYCKEEERRSMRGVKQMKDKERLTIMVCTSCVGMIRYFFTFYFCT